MKYRALSVCQPYADWLTKPSYKDAEGNWKGAKEIEVRSWKTNYRGDILICSTAKPIIPTHESGIICGLVELYEVKPIEQLTEAEWAQTMIPESERGNWKGCFAWFVKNPRRVVEFPIKGKQGLFSVDMEITEYPRELYLGDKGWEKIKKQIR